MYVLVHVGINGYIKVFVKYEGSFSYKSGPLPHNIVKWL